MFDSIIKTIFSLLGQKQDQPQESAVAETQEESPQEKPNSNPDPSECREWRLTEYYSADQADHLGLRTVPILDNFGRIIEMASPAFFSSLALEGSGITGEKKLVNVSGKWVSVDHDRYALVLDWHKKFMSKRPFSYSGLKVENDRVTKVVAFYEVPSEKVGEGYGICNGIPMVPYRTLAADIGRTQKSDPNFKNSGGVVPVGTRVYIHEFVGVKLPDGTTHDGWFTVNDTGGGIYGAHFDVFIGVNDNKKFTKIPRRARIWFDGVDKLPTPYTYGLDD